MHQYWQTTQLNKLLRQFTFNARAFATGHNESIFGSIQGNLDFGRKIVRGLLSANSYRLTVIRRVY